MHTPYHLLQNKVLDLLIDAVCVVDREGVFLFVSAAGERIFGYPPAEMVGKRVLDFLHPEDQVRTLRAIDEIHDGDPKTHFENRYVRKDGSVAHIMWSARWSEADQIRVAVARDVTNLKRAEALRNALYTISEAAHAAEDLQALCKRIHEVVNEMVPANHFVLSLRDVHSGELSFPYSTCEAEGAEAHVDVTQILCSEIIKSGQPLLLTPEISAALLFQSENMTKQQGLDWLGVPLISSDGPVGALVMQNHVGAAPYTEQDRELLQFVSTQVASAIERMRTQTRLLFMAQHDSLTCLPNRALFLDRLHNALQRARREKSRLAVLFVDMDDFKSVNDRYGHAVGDQLLQEVALRLKRSVRESDTVARLGGDEFVVMLNDITTGECALRVAEKIIADLQATCEIQGHVLTMLPSVGVAVYPEDGETEGDLMRHADNAMYQAKRGGGNRHSRQVLTEVHPH